MSPNKEDRDKQVTIIVNTREKLWEKNAEISYLEVVKLAYDSYVYDGTHLYTVTYSKGHDSNHEGILEKDESVKVKDGMIFNVKPTNKS